MPAGPPAAGVAPVSAPEPPPRPRRRSIRPRAALAWGLFCRFQILLALAFVAFPFLARGPWSLLFANLFVLSWREQVLVGALALAVGRVLVTTGWTATRTGPLRLWPGLGPQPLDSSAAREGSRGAEPGSPAASMRLGYREFRNAFRRSWGTSRRWVRLLPRLEPWIALALAAPTLGAVVVASSEPPAGLSSAAWGWARAGAILAALVAVEGAIAVAALVAAWLTPPEAKHVVPASALGRWLAGRAGRSTPALARRLRDRLTTLLAHSPFGPGYVWVDPRGRRHLHSGHLAAAGLFAATTLAYVAIGLAVWPWRAPWTEPPLPALGALLLVLLVGSWLLPGVSFLLDRYRVPVVPALLLLSLGLHATLGADHFFPLRAPADGVPARADEDLERVVDWLGPPADGSPARPIVVVAAEGGGITAAAWTATVLAELSTGPSGGDFLASLKMISGVSGGAVGAMFFLDRLPEVPLDRMGPQSLAWARGVEAAASASSLDSVGWGLAYPDLARALFAFPVSTFFPQVDRSWALAESWRRRLLHPHATLATWRRDGLAGKKPLVMFNATSVETGERFVMSNLAVGPSGSSPTFWSAFPCWDVDATNAVQLSSTFPLVGIAARARPAHCSRPSGELAAPADHFVDGGYADNSGAVSALELLDRLLRARCTTDAACASTPPILILRLRAFDPAAASIADVTRTHNAWLTSALSPIETLQAVRSASQRDRNALELDAFTRHWSERNVRLALFDITLGGLGPLSWKLTAAETARIGSEWIRQARLQDGEVDRLRAALLGRDFVAWSCEPRPVLGPHHLGEDDRSRPDVELGS